MIRTWFERKLGYLVEMGWPAVFGTLFLFVASSFFLILGWGKWPDIFVDFGRELYIPWQLSEGKVLYRDIFFYYGPFSKYLYALFFKIFSASLVVVTAINFTVLILFSFIAYRLMRTFSSRQASWLAIGAFYSLLAFGQYAGIGNYNFISPYSHELLHGLVLSCCVLYLLLRYMGHMSLGMGAIIGGLTGVVFLTKVEVFVALFISLFVAGVVSFFLKGKAAVLRKENVVPFMAGFWCPSLMAWLYFTFHMGAKEAFEALIYPYAAIFNTRLSTNIFYKGFSGWDDPWGSVRLMLTSTFWIGLVLGGAFFLTWITALLRPRVWRWVVGVLISVFVTVGLWIAVTRYVPAYGIFRPLPLFCASLAVFLGVRLFFLARYGGGLPEGPLKTREDIAHNLKVFIYSVFAMAMMLKISLYGHIFHSGFVLALPALLLVVVVFFDTGTRCVRRYAQGSEWLFQVMFILMLASVVVSYGISNIYYYRAKNYSFGSERGRLLTYDQRLSLTGPGMQDALAYLKKLPPQTTVSVLPGGVMLNFMSGLPASTKFFEFSPSFFYMASEIEVLEAFKASPSDYIVLVDWNMSEHGAAYFGKDYGVELFGWLARHYEPVRLFGAVPNTGKGFGVLIARKAR